MTRAEEAAVARAVDAAPPMSTDQQARLRILLAPQPVPVRSAA
jgi:hypothetical protein